MIRLSFALIAMGTGAVANTLCEDLNSLEADTLTLSQGTLSCGPSLALGGVRNMHCVLEFPYRSPAATAAFEAILAELTTCLGPSVVPTTDQSVNHPEAYDLREFSLDGRQYGVSIKDKGALQQTLVFVRVSRP